MPPDTFDRVGLFLRTGTPPAERSSDRTSPRSPSTSSYVAQVKTHIPLTPTPDPSLNLPNTHRSSAKKRYDENLIKNLLSKILDFSFKTFNHTLPLIISHPFLHLSYCHFYSLSCLTHFHLSFLLLILSHTLPLVIPTPYPVSHLTSCHSYSLSCLTPFLLSFLLLILSHTFPPVIPTPYPVSHLSSCHSYFLSCLTPFLLSFLLLILSHTFPPTIRIRYPIPHLFFNHSYSHFLYNFNWIVSHLFIHSSSNNYFLITQHSLFFSVLVTAFNKEQGGTKLLVSLHRGMSFGVRAF